MAAAGDDYRAFLSYAHADHETAVWLHRALEQFHIDRGLRGRKTAAGVVPKSLAPIFRDRDEFVVGHSLTEETARALGKSAGLIVLCSRVAAGRPTVNEEVRQFRARFPTRPVVPVIIDDAYPDNYPPALRYEIAADGSVTDRPIRLLGSDLREGADGKQLGLAKTVAGLLGVGTDEIVQRAQNRQRRLMWSWIAGLSAVIVLLTGLAFWAELNRHIAEKRYNLAADAAIDLVVLQATMKYVQEGARADDDALFFELLRFEKENNDIFQRLVSEKRESWECNKIKEFELLGAEHSREGQALLSSLDNVDQAKRDRIVAGWNYAAARLKSEYGGYCSEYAARGGGAYSGALESIIGWLRSTGWAFRR